MTIDHNEALITLKLKLVQKQKSQRFVRALKAKLSLEKQRLNDLFEIMQKEELDVKKLEKLSIASMYHSLVGNKQQQLNKEQVEFFAAKLKFDSCQKSINSLKRDILGYQDQIDEYTKHETEYLESIKKNHTSYSNEENLKLIEITDEIVQLKSNNVEINEAITAGRQVKKALNGIIEKMQSASGWGVFDMFAGGLGGIIVTAVKHSKINESQEMVEKVKIQIEKFHRELSDIENNQYMDLDINIGGFTKFADYFFDGLIFDWMAQSKINKSLKAFIDIEKETSDILKSLLIQSSNSKKQVAKFNQSKLDLLQIN